MKRRKIFTRFRLLFAFVLTALLIFNATSMRARRAADRRWKAQIQLSEIIILAAKFDKLSETHIRKLSEAMQAGSVSDENLLATFPDEFLVLKQDQQDPDETKVSLFVPKKGQHRIRVEIWEQEKKLCDHFFDIESGRRSDILFRVGDDWIETEFPGQQPVRNNLRELILETKSWDLETPALFVSPNQAPWRKGVAFFDETRVGILSQFRFRTQVFDLDAGLHRAVSVRISAESDGPMSAAADDHLTMLRLMEMADQTRPLIPYRYENGRYFFE